MDYSPPGSSVQGILQARILESVAVPSSMGPSPPRDWTHISLYLLHSNVGSFSTTATWEAPQVLYSLAKADTCCKWMNLEGLKNRGLKSEGPKY